jgi:AcrR family transcriptional regulator
LTVARRLFAARGYEATSNRLIADEAGLTTGAIYHYFDRKLDIFAAVYADTQEMVYERFERAIDGHHTFVGRLEAVLETAHALNNDDPSLAKFLGASRVDAARNATIAEALALGQRSRRSTFFVDLIDFGIATGEIDGDAREIMHAVMLTITTGLVDEVSNDRVRHRRAIDGIIGLVSGKLLHAPIDRGDS